MIIRKVYTVTSSSRVEIGKRKEGSEVASGYVVFDRYATKLLVYSLWLYVSGYGMSLRKC